MTEKCDSGDKDTLCCREKQQKWRQRKTQKSSVGFKQRGEPCLVVAGDIDMKSKTGLPWMQPSFNRYHLHSVTYFEFTQLDSLAKTVDRAAGVTQDTVSVSTGVVVRKTRHLLAGMPNAFSTTRLALDRL